MEADLLDRECIYPEGYLRSRLSPRLGYMGLRVEVEEVRNGSAAERDGIASEMVKHIEERLFRIMNRSLEEVLFPTLWKSSRLKLIFKEGGQRSFPKVTGRSASSLLLAIGKDDIILPEPCPGWCWTPSVWVTADAIDKLRLDIRYLAEKYTVIIKFYISSAFDGVWWPLITELRNNEKDVRANQGLPHNRNVKISASTYEIETDIERGFPLGSVLCLTKWKLVSASQCGQPISGRGICWLL